MQQDRLKNLAPVSVQYGKIPFKDFPCIILLMSIDQDGDKKWKPIGTAFPVFHDGVVTILTAAHVFKGLHGFPIYAKNDSNVISLHGAHVTFNAELDIAAIQCSSSALSVLFDTCLCIAPEENVTATSDSGTDAVYQAFGYPQSKNKFSRTKPFITQALRISLGHEKSYPIKSKLTALEVPLLCFDLSPDNLVDEMFQKTSQLQVFDGISGGPVIRYPISKDSTDGVLVGMFVEWHKLNKTAVVIPWVVISAWLTNWCAPSKS